MRLALLIAAKDLRQRLRDRSAVVVAFVAPFALAAIISLATGGTEDFSARFVLADEDGGPAATAFVEVLRSPELRDLVRLDRVGSAAEARRRVNRDRADAAFVVPPGFSEAVGTGRPARVAVLTHVERPVAGEVARGLAEGFAAELSAARLAVATALAAGAPTDRLAELVESARQRRVPVELTTRPVGTREIEAVNYFGPSMAIFFLFFVVGFGAKGLLAERRQGTLGRLRAAPLRAGHILAGKALSVLVFGLASKGVVVVATSVVFGARWGEPVAVGVLTLATVLAAVGVTALVITLARTEQQADTLSSIVVFGLALLGGNFVFISATPELFRRLSLLTPNGWAIRGFLDLASSDEGLGLVMPSVAAVTAFAAVTGGLALARAHRLVAT